MAEKPRWGFIEIILVFLGIFSTGPVVSLLCSWFPVIKTGFGMGDTGYFLFAFMIQFLLTVGLIYIVVIVWSGGSWSELGIKKTGWRNFLLYGVLGGLFLIVVITLLGFVVNIMQPQLAPQYYEEVLRSAANIVSTLLIILVGAVLGPFAEELFYRGMVYPVFRSRIGPLWGAILAGLVFGMVHQDLWRAIPLAVGGAILCYIYEKTDSILVTTVAHGVWNGTMSLIVFFSVAKGLL